MQTLTIKTDTKRQVIDITSRIAEMSAGHTGIATVFVQHTTAALTTADLDPGTDLDLLDGLSGLLPDVKWRHPHNPDHAPDHLLASLIGSTVVVPVQKGELQLGTWQSIVLIELDGPRERQLVITLSR